MDRTDAATRIAIAVLGAFAFTTFIACGRIHDGDSPAAALPEAGTTEASAAPIPDDAAAPPARPPAPKVTTKGGPVLASPRLVVATFDDDPLAPRIETFAWAIGTSSYWKAVTSEYGVGPATFARAVNVAGAPAQVEVEAVGAWLAGELDGTHPEWGAPDPSAIYTIVYPTTTSVSVGGDASCDYKTAWRNELLLPGGVRVAYVVLGRCDSPADSFGIDYVTKELSGAWIEAATDPLVHTNPAFRGTATDGAWTAVTSGEPTILCELLADPTVTPHALPFKVVRSWSNASAAAGHDPCVPRTADPYFAAAPFASERVVGGPHFWPYRVDAGADWVDGIVVPVGATRTVDVKLFADGDTHGPWMVDAFNTGSSASVGDPSTDPLVLTLDKASGVAGDVLHLTITRVRKDDSFGGTAILELVSTQGSTIHVWLVAVGDAAK